MNIDLSTDTPAAGPFGTEAEASAAAKALGGPPEEGWSILSEGQRRLMLTTACEAAGVGLGDYDARILAWLANWEDGICAVVAGLITRAGAAAAPEPAVTVFAVCAGCDRGTRSAPCPRCGGPACAGCGRCPPCDGPVPDDAGGGTGG